MSATNLRDRSRALDAPRAQRDPARARRGAMPGVLAPTIFMLGLSASSARPRSCRASTPTTSARSSSRSACCRARASPARRPASTSRATSSRAGSTGCCVAPAPRADAARRRSCGSALPALRCCRRRSCSIVAFALGVALARASTALLLAARADHGPGGRDGVLRDRSLALRFRTQQAAPLMQMGASSSILFTTAYAPMRPAADWLRRDRRRQPGDARARGRAPGLRRRRDVGDTWPALRRGRRARSRSSARSPCAACAARAI